MVTTPSAAVLPTASPSGVHTPPIQRLAYQGVFVPTGPLDTNDAFDAYVRLADGRVLGIGGSSPERKTTGPLGSHHGALLRGRSVGRQAVAADRGAPPGRPRPHHWWRHHGACHSRLAARRERPPTRRPRSMTRRRALSRQLGRWSARVGHHPRSRLADRRVLVLDGISVDDAYAPDPLLATAEIYDPATDRFNAVEPMAIHRGSANMALLDDGHVLVVGGTFRIGRRGAVRTRDRAVRPDRLAPARRPAPRRRYVLAGGRRGSDPTARRACPRPGAPLHRDANGHGGPLPHHGGDLRSGDRDLLDLDPDAPLRRNGNVPPRRPCVPDRVLGCHELVGDLRPIDRRQSRRRQRARAGRYMEVVGLADGGVLVVGGRRTAEIFR